MPVPMKLKVGICSFSYGGNGGIRSEVPDVRDWMLDTFAWARKEPRIETLMNYEISDTPITMTRNRAVVDARKMGLDVLVMVDSDMKPDCEPGGKPFFPEAFDFLYKSYARGPVVIGAPYCGPSPNECVYVFKWESSSNSQANPNHKLTMFSRREASQMSGIGNCAALPTGLIMFDMRAFDLTEPVDMNSKPWFYYDWSDKYQCEKASTEDVTVTRDISLAGVQKLGYNPLYCAWDSWAGHWKPHLVTKPQELMADNVSHKYAEAYESKLRGGDKYTCVHSHLTE